MTMLNESTIQELRQILAEDYGKNMSIAEASEIAHMLVGYYDLLAKIHHQDQFINQHHEPKNSE